MWLTAIDFPPIAHGDDKNDKSPILKIADDPVIVDAIGPERSEVRSLEGLAQLPRVIERGYSVAQERIETARRVGVELFELPPRLLIELNRPGQVRGLFPLESRF